MKHASTALALVAIGVVHGVAWKLATTEYGPIVWNTTGSLFRAALLCFIGLAYRSKTIWLAVVLLAGFELQTASCSIWYLIDPWLMRPGDEMCSVKLHFPVGLVSLWAALIIVKIIRDERNAKPIH